MLDIADEYIITNPKIRIGLYRHAEMLVGNNWKELPI